jgi:hypothetical protein
MEVPMSHHETLIDPTHFGTVARYLHDPQSPIQYVLHVKEESMLAEVAAKLDAAMAASQGKPQRGAPQTNQRPPRHDDLASIPPTSPRASLI